MPELMSPVITPRKQANWFKRPIGIIVIVALIVAVGTFAGVLYMNHWYHQNLQPLSSEATKVRVTIPQGADVTQISKLLKDKGIIRSSRAFSRYVDNSHNKERLQAGTYLFSPSYSVQKIVGMLANGEIDTFKLTLAPGKRLDQIQASLEKAGYDANQIKTAFAKTYTSPLLADKPATADLEGYIFPDTYQLNSETSPEQLVQLSLDNFYKRLQAEGLIEKIHQKGFTLHQAFTLASIIQQEASDPNEQRTISQVFQLRLAKNMALGSDVTFMYASHKADVPDYPNIDSPYNTRLYKGLPPGPIGNFNMTALEAVVNPAASDYLFFVAGDNGKIYYSHTDEEHQQLTKQYCTKLCQ